MSARRALFPALVLALGVVGSAVLVQGRPAAPPLEMEPDRPAAHVLPVVPETVRLRVLSQGTVSPRTESELVAEVPGQVVEVGPGLEPGAFFRAGEVLARLDPGDLDLAVERASAAVARARAEEEYARATHERQLSLRESGIASSARVDETRRAARIAEARRREAEVDLKQAERDRDRTRIVAPFDGRTGERRIDVGRFVSVGTPIARVYAVDYAEVRLPVPDAELAYLDLPLGGEADSEMGPEVILSARFAGQEHLWSGRILRTEAEIDPRTRMVTLVARVPRPYERSANDVRPPLAARLFVRAEILGRRVEDVVRVPRAALAEEGGVWVVDVDDRLRRRPVEVLRFERDTALVSGGLLPGERVSLLEPRLAREGLSVRPLQPGTVARHGAPPEPAS